MARVITAMEICKPLAPLDPLIWALRFYTTTSVIHNNIYRCIYAATRQVILTGRQSFIMGPQSNRLCLLQASDTGQGLFTPTHSISRHKTHSTFQHHQSSRTVDTTRLCPSQRPIPTSWTYVEDGSRTTKLVLSGQRDSTLLHTILQPST